MDLPAGTDVRLTLRMVRTAGLTDAEVAIRLRRFLKELSRDWRLRVLRVEWPTGSSESRIEDGESRIEKTGDEHG